MRSFYSLLILAVICIKTVLLADVWSPPELLDTSAIQPAIAVDAQGNAVAVYVHSDGINTCVKAATLAVGQPWSTPLAISQPSPYWCRMPSVAIDSKGNAVAVWICNTPDNAMVVLAARKPAGSNSWTLAEPLADPAPFVCELKLTLDKQGNALAVWTTGQKETANLIASARLKSLESSWEQIKPLARNSSIACLDVAVDLKGNAWMIWNSDAIQIASLASHADQWSEPQKLSAASVLDVKICVDADGNALALWAENEAIKAYARPYGSSDWEETIFSKEALTGRYMQVAFDRTGTAYALYTSNDTANQNVLRFTTLPFKSRTWSTPINVIPTGDAMFWQIFSDIDTAGNAVVVLFTGGWGANGVIQATTKAANSPSWSSPTPFTMSAYISTIACKLSHQNGCTIIYSDGAPYVYTITGSELFQPNKQPVFLSNN